MACKSRTSSKLTDMNIDTLCALIRKGVPHTVAIEKMGISRITLWTWLHEDDEKNPRSNRSKLLKRLKEEFGKARAYRCEQLIEKMQSAGEGDWRMYQFQLERQYSEEFGATTKIEADVKHSGELSFAASVLKDMAENFVTQPIQEDDDE